VQWLLYFIALTASPASSVKQRGAAPLPPPPPFLSIFPPASWRHRISTGFACVWYLKNFSEPFSSIFFFRIFVTADGPYWCRCLVMMKYEIAIRRIYYSNFFARPCEANWFAQTCLFAHVAHVFWVVGRSQAFQCLSLSLSLTSNSHKLFWVRSRMSASIPPNPFPLRTNTH